MTHHHDAEEVTLVARGIATAVATDDGLTDVQADLLEGIASALTGVDVDYRGLEPIRRMRASEVGQKVPETRDLPAAMLRERAGDYDAVPLRYGIVNA